MARFERRSGGPLFSPDQNYFALVTSRGILASDEIESTLWLFSSERVRQYLRHKSASLPAPRVLARFRAVPQADYSDSYEPIISSVRWQSDSRTLLFLVQNLRGERQLYDADLRSGVVRALSKRGLDINLYANVANTVAYMATSSSEPVRLGHDINQDATDVTGLDWSSFLFVDPLAATSLRCNELWLVRNKKNRRVGRDDDRLCLVNRSDQVISLSPDARFAIVVSPVQQVPESWVFYRPGFPDRKIDPTSPDEAAPTNPLRLARYEIVRLDDGVSYALMDSPNAWSRGFPDANGAVWSHDEQEIILMNTYLPLDVSNSDVRARRMNPCSAALVELASRSTTCLAFSDYPRKKRFLVSASFAPDDKAVALDYWDPETSKVRVWAHKHGGIWQEDSSDSGGPSDSSAQDRTVGGHLQERLSVQVKQDLNTPPVVWAAESESTPSEKIWDPNPQLANYALGETSVFHWIDQGGYRWTGALVKPPDYIKGKRYPLVIQTHGFLDSEFMTDGAYTTAFAARPLAAAGFVVLQMGENYNYGSLSEEASLQMLGFESAIEQLVSQGIVDRDEVGIIGFSRTCYHVEAAMIKTPRLFSAAVIADGVDESYMQEMLFGVSTSTHESDEIYGAKPLGEGLTRWFASAPGFHLDRVQTALLIQALRPESVLAEWEIYSSLVMQRKPVDLVYFPEGQHILQRPLERLASQQASVDWFSFWLKDEETPNGVSASEHIAWRKMKDMRAAGNR